MSGNLRAGLRHRSRSIDPMAEFDRLPPGARAWAHAAALPWSARSIARQWAAALSRHGGDEAAARAALDAIERRMLARDPVFALPAPDRSPPRLSRAATR